MIVCEYNEGGYDVMNMKARHIASAPRKRDEAGVGGGRLEEGMKRGRVGSGAEPASRVGEGNRRRQYCRRGQPGREASSMRRREPRAARASMVKGRRAAGGEVMGGRG